MANDYLKESIECFCPRCETTHIKHINWNGTGKPRMYCTKCSSLKKGSSIIEINQINGSKVSSKNTNI